MIEPKIPKHCKRYHEKPYWRGNSLAGIKRAKRKGYRYIDQDINLTKGDANAEKRDDRPVAVVKHWPKLYKDGFTSIEQPAVGGRKPRRVLHKMSRGVKIADLPWSTVSKLRRPKGAARYYRARTHMAVCKDTGIVLCAEVKGDRRFESLNVMKDLRADAIATGAVVYVMTLQNLGRPRERLKAAHNAGFQTALLARGRKPSNWATESAPYVDVVWGKWKGAKR